MSNSNIHQIANFVQLKKLVTENLTVIIGLTCPDTQKASKIMVRKFLKEKSKLFPLIQFVYMELSEDQIDTTKLEIVSKDYDSYPLVYHIRDGNKILCGVEAADYESTYDSFDEVAPYYKKEMEDFAESVSNKRGKKANTVKKTKRAKVVINVSSDQTDSESEIEIEKESGGSRGSRGSKEATIESEENNSQKAKTSEQSQNQKEMDPAFKAAVEREKYYAIEDAYDDMQKKLFDEVKDRIKIEQKEAEEEKKAMKKKAKSKSKSGKRQEEKKPSKPQRDQIGPSSKTKGKQVVRRNRRR
jgi:hypothetical protein